MNKAFNKGSLDEYTVIFSYDPHYQKPGVYVSLVLAGSRVEAIRKGLEQHADDYKLGNVALSELELDVLLVFEGHHEDVKHCEESSH